MSFTRRNLLLFAAAVGIAAGPATAYAEGVLNVGSYPNNPPFEFKAESGNFEGFEVDIVTEAAKRIGMTVNIEGYDFQPLFAATSSGRIDVAISSITITPERLGSQSFTQPYYDSDMGIAAKTDSADQGPRRPQGQDHRRARPARPARNGPRSNKAAQGFAEIKGYNTQQELLLDLAARPRRRRGQRHPRHGIRLHQDAGPGSRQGAHQDRRAVRPHDDQGSSAARQAQRRADAR